MIWPYTRTLILTVTRLVENKWMVTGATLLVVVSVDDMNMMIISYCYGAVLKCL